MAYVFISYKHEDADFAELLKGRLEKGRIQTWMDSDIQGGEKWSPAIDNAIESSFAVVVIMSPDARKSEYVAYEWAFALGLKRPVVPILLKATDLHPKLEEFQYMDFTSHNARPWDKLIARLKRLAPSKTSPAIPTQQQNQPKSIQTMPELLKDIEAFISSLGKDVQLKQNKQYIACKKNQSKTNFASIVAGTQRILIIVKLNPDEVNLEAGFTRDVRNKGIWGTGDLEIRLNRGADLEKAKPLIVKSYELN